MKKITMYAAMIFTVLFAIACDNDGNQLEKDIKLIEEYIDANGLSAESTTSSLYFVIDEPGNNEHPAAGDDISIKYTGWLLNGEEFDSSDGKVVTFPLNNLIKGWKEGIPLFGKGGKGTLIIPSHLGYGPNGTQSGSIPPNAVIVFDIELINFN
jgi:FKBP-type peptidyl-prolyl cis-trans isomerase FkpA